MKHRRARFYARTRLAVGLTAVLFISGLAGCSGADQTGTAGGASPGRSVSATESSTPSTRDAETNGMYDVATVEVLVDGTPTLVWAQSSATPSQAEWTDSGAISLAAFAGKSIELRFAFDSKNAHANDFTGWLIDDVVVTN